MAVSSSEVQGQRKTTVLKTLGLYRVGSTGAARFYFVHFSKQIHSCAFISAIGLSSFLVVVICYLLFVIFVDFQFFVGFFWYLV
jgi:hypothetical protein